MTICAWINKTAGGSIKGIVDKSFDDTNTSTYGGWSFFVNPDNSLGWWVGHPNGDSFNRIFEIFRG
jgi:hypothetical protein